MSEKLPDVQQNKEGFYKRGIEKVGVRGIKVPMKIQGSSSGYKNVVASISSYCSLDEGTKGINMSRIARSINEVNERDIDPIINLDLYLEELKIAHGATDVYIKASFDYLIKKASPITKLVSWEPIKVVFESIFKDDVTRHYLTVESTEMSLCPCSKEMSLLMNNLTISQQQQIDVLSPDLQAKLDRAGFGAHNQKSVIKITVELYDWTEPGQTFYIEDLYGLIQESASAPTFAVLKRPDEKYLTEISYMGGYYEDGIFIKVPGTGPKFVEDISRDAAQMLDEDMMCHYIDDYVIVVNNQESIHSEDIVATSILSAGKRLK